MDGNSLGKALANAIFGLVVIAFVIGALAMWGLPKLWELVKPLIHAATA